MVINYENGKIYKIIGNVPNDPCYVGSTTKDYLSQRMAKHVYNYNSWKKGNKENKIMSFELFDKYGVENCKIMLLESVEAKSKDELRIKEQEYIEKLSCINQNRAICTSDDKIRLNKQYYEKNRTVFLKQRKEYRKINAEKIKLKKSLKYQCIYCDNEFNYNHKSRHERSSRHIDNTIHYMKSTIDKYTEQTNMESNIIQHFSLE